VGKVSEWNEREMLDQMCDEDKAAYLAEEQRKQQAVEALSALVKGEASEGRKCGNCAHYDLCRDNEYAAGPDQNYCSHGLSAYEPSLESQLAQATQERDEARAREALIRHALEAEMYDCANCDDIRDSKEFTSKACRKCATGNSHRVLKMTETEAQAEVAKQLAERDMYKGLFDGVCKQRDRFTEMLRERGVGDNEIHDVISSFDFEFTPSPAYDEWKAMRAVVEAARKQMDAEAAWLELLSWEDCDITTPEFEVAEQAWHQAGRDTREALAAWKEARP
jgi:hypothetical protein